MTQPPADAPPHDRRVAASATGVPAAVTVWATLTDRDHPDARVSITCPAHGAATLRVRHFPQWVADHTGHVAPPPETACRLTPGAVHDWPGAEPTASSTYEEILAHGRALGVRIADEPAYVAAVRAELDRGKP